MVRHAVEVNGHPLSTATVWQSLYQCQLLRECGSRWIGREPGGLPASAIPHMLLAEASALAAARAIERAAMVEAAALRNAWGGGPRAARASRRAQLRRRQAR